MKFALFVIAVYIITLHATTVVAKHGYVYTVAEVAGKQGYTGFVKIGHSSESKNENDKFSNLRQRFFNMQTGNPRRLEIQFVYECRSKKAANDAENLIRDYAKKVDSANHLGGSDEWIYIDKIRSAKIIAHVNPVAKKKRCKLLDNKVFPPNLLKIISAKFW